MQCPSCGAISDKADCCVELHVGSLDQEVVAPNQLNMNVASDSSTQTPVKKSTLIEFPGVNRTSIPEWRKELSERVREVQERRAREAAREAADQKRQAAEAEVTTHQLELLPHSDLPAMNPLVAAALKRIERAHQSGSEARNVRQVVATAVAYAPAREENEPEVIESLVTTELPLEAALEPEPSRENNAVPPIEKSHNLTVVPPIEETVSETHPSTQPTPRRLILENDPSLNYLDSISHTVRVDEIDSRRPSAFRRLVCGLSDLLICASLCVPIAFAMRATETELKDPRAIEVLAGSLLAVTFLYLTLTIALTGRTLAMRLFSLRVIDIKTGLIPTGRQSIGRSVLYLASLAFAGIGVIVALMSREGFATHDRLTRTAVIKT
ncbi:MAG TPA: RDD family protein [Pyrinomonadaceae bacterium]